MSKKIEVIGLSKRFNAGKEILDDVSFDVEESEFLSILGPSGCGKTTLLRILIGLLSPTSGKIIKDGIDITLLPPDRRSMGIVFQNYALFENMSAIKNVAYALYVHHDTKEDAYKKAEEILTLMGLSKDIFHLKPAMLSGGQQQRVAIARTLALGPDVILFDEPLSALDIDTRILLRKEIKTLQKKLGTTMIYVTHDQEEAFSLSDRIMVMQNGKIEQIGTPDELIDNPSSDYVRHFVRDNIEAKIEGLIRFYRKEELTK